MARVDANEVIQLQVHMRLRNEKEADAELAAISDPDSSVYGQFLGDEQFDAKYGPTAEAVALVRAHLEASGLRVTRVADDRAYIAVEGAASNVETAFGTHLGTYRVGDAMKRAPIEAPALPASVTPHVLTVLGLSTPIQMKPRHVRVGGVKRNSFDPNAGAAARTCAEWYGQVTDSTDPPLGGGYPHPLSYLPCGYKPAQLREAYGFSNSVRRGNDGTGKSVAIVDAYMSPTLLADAQTYFAQNDADYPLDAAQFSAQMAPGTPTPVDTGWYGEQTLDVEAVHAMAPGAKIVFVGAQSANDQDLVAAINLIISKRLASIVSNSYGSPEGQANDFVIWHQIAKTAGLKGIGLYFSSGDSGDEAANLGFASPDFPASLDNATAVGGTSLALGRTGGRTWELGWETGVTRLQAVTVDGGATGAVAWTPAAPGLFVFGAGGGTSYVYDQPSYQVSVVPSPMANIPGAPARVVPDVAMLADPETGYLIGETDPVSGVYGESVYGGTSLSCPLFAATMALAEQHASRHFGFANPLLYKASKHGAFHDIKPGATPQAAAVRPGVVVTFDYVGLAIQTAPGYDNVTGVGVPNGTAFLNAVR